MYAQRDEDDAILEWFKDKKRGRFLDIGAYDAKVFSQTRGLYEVLDWSGVLVEGAAARFHSLMKEYNNDPKITLVNAVVSASQSGFVSFWQNEDAVSTVNEDNRKKWEKSSPFTKTFIFMVTLEKLFGAFPGPYDFINIDVEGGSYDLFRAALSLSPGTSMFCVEYDSHLDDALEIARSRGYRELHRTIENSILVRE